MKKRILTLALAIVMLLACAPSVLAANVAATVSTNPVVLDGFDLSVPMYAIGGYNYVKLRDIAKLLSDYGRNITIEVGYENGCVTLEPWKLYTEYGVELTALSAAKSIGPSTGKVSYNGKPVDLKGYAIDGFNFYQLRDVGRVLDIAVYWDVGEGCVVIDTAYPNSFSDKLQAESAEVFDPEDELAHFGAKVPSIYNWDYTGYAQKGSTEFETYATFTDVDVPEGAMGYRVADLDDDGQPELLVVFAERGKVVKSEDEYVILPRLSVYEWNDATRGVELADSVLLEYSPYDGAVFRPRVFLDESNFDVFLGTNNGGTYIGVASCKRYYWYTDGLDNVFFVCQYRNGRIRNYIEPVEMFSSGYVEEYLDDLAKELKKGGITVKGDDIFGTEIGANMSKHVKNYRGVCFASSKNVSGDGLDRWIESSSWDLYPANVITVKNTGDN